MALDNLKLQVRYARKGVGPTEDGCDRWVDTDRDAVVGSTIHDAFDAIQAALEEIPGTVEGWRSIIVTDGGDEIGGWEFRLAKKAPTKQDKVNELNRLLDDVGLSAGSATQAAFCSGVLGRDVTKDVENLLRGWRKHDLNEDELDRCIEVAKRL